MSGVKQPIQIVHYEGMTIAGEQVVVPVLELPCTFLQCIVPCGLPFRFEKLVALQNTKDQYLVVSHHDSSISHFNVKLRRETMANIHYRVQTSSLFTWIYRATAPKAKLSTDIRFGPAKSKITPSSLQMPMWPIKGTNHVINGIGVHTIQQGKRALLGSI